MSAQNTSPSVTALIGRSVISAVVIFLLWALFSPLPALRADMLGFSVVGGFFVGVCWPHVVTGGVRQTMIQIGVAALVLLIAAGLFAGLVWLLVPQFCAIQNLACT